MLKMIFGEQTVTYMLSQISVVSVFLVLVLVAVCIDLCSGIRASKEIGDFKTNSHGIRRTGRKLMEYWSLLIMSLLIDFGLLTFTMISDQVGFLLIFKIPIISIAVFIAVMVTEFLSVKENIEIRKGKRIIPEKTVTLLADMAAKVGEGDNKINAKTVADMLRVIAGEKEIVDKKTDNDGI